MHRFYALALVFTISLILPVSLLANPRAMTVPADSFINRHVDSVPQLTQQVTLDPSVRRRLARHFHVSGPAVVRYIQDNLVLRKTTRTQRYQVYCISRTGHEYTINARLPIGTPIFVLRTTGEPILKLACGNPMVSALPIIKRAGSQESLPKFAELSPSAPGVPAKIAPKLAPNALVIAHVGGKPTSSLVLAPVTKVAGGIYELPVHSSRAPWGYLFGIPFAAGLYHQGGGSQNGGPFLGGTNSGTGTNTGTGNNSGGNTGISTGTNSGTNTGANSGTNVGTNSGTNTGSNTGNLSPVPEPSEKTAFVIGGLVIAFLLFRKRRRRRFIA